MRREPLPSFDVNPKSSSDGIIESIESHFEIKMTSEQYRLCLQKIRNIKRGIEKRFYGKIDFDKPYCLIGRQEGG